MKKVLFSALALVAIGASAATVTISKGPKSASCVSGGGSITQDGEIYIACLTDPVLTGVDGPVPAPAPAPPATGCSPAASIDTGPITSGWTQHTYKPVPSAVLAFKITVPEGFNGRSMVYAAQTAASSRAKLVVVSTCPGVLTPVGDQAACSAIGTESTTVRLSGKPADLSYYCKLTPGVYYVNAWSKAKVADSGYTCTDTASCSFYAGRSDDY